MASNHPQLDIFDGKNGTQSGESPAKLDGRKSPAYDLGSSAHDTPGKAQPYLDVPLQNSFRSTIDTLSGVSTYSADNENDRTMGRSRLPTLERIASRSPAPVRAIAGKRAIFWQKYKGITLMLIAQLFGGFMNAATRMLEVEDTHGPPMSPFQILFVRMSITTVCSLAYMYFTGVEHAPFGKGDVRKLLVLRGLTGFVGVYGIYYSLIYLPIAEAVVITFVAPIISCWAYSIFFHEPFGLLDQIAGLISFAGVILIAQPSWLFGTETASASETQGPADHPIAANVTVPTFDANGIPVVTSSQRLSAVIIGFIGACGAAGAYTTLRYIGKRAHPLISVNYFATWCMIVSGCALLFVPSVEFRLPANLREWSLLLSLGTCGFVMQFLLTAGLAHDKSARATQMVYMQILFGIAFDKLIWNVTPGIWSCIGSLVVLASALYVAVWGAAAKAGGKATERGRGDEEVGLVADGDNEEDGLSTKDLLRGVQELQLGTLRT
ncbi:hypothetical protein MMC30_000668 [Trapelia coarctata]|nr:hypothetical protein [Trapelia coarctata]